VLLLLLLLQLQLQDQLADSIRILTVLSGLTMTAKSQLNRIFSTLERALKLISTTFPNDPNRPFDYPVIVFDNFNELASSIVFKSGTFSAC
jgi:hypothetical protein